MVRVSTTYHRAKPDTISGESLIVTTVYSSWDVKEIDALQRSFRDHIGSGLITEMEVPLDGGENEKPHRI